jgi:protein-S-isoprenylcysteine O-methyltransferase Ste14
MLFLRALLAFLALPGMVAFVVPLLIFRRGPLQDGVHPAGIIVLTAGIVVLCWCVRDFYTLGRGTLAPWDPPRALVVRGLYRFTRNPMYVGVLCIVSGWALSFRSTDLALYALLLAALFHVRVVVAEEPFLARTHGATWDDYKRRVPRWLGRAR